MEKKKELENNSSLINDTLPVGERCRYFYRGVSPTAFDHAKDLLDRINECNATGKNGTTVKM